MKSPQCVENKVRIAPPPPDYSKENFLATFAPQRNLTPEQIFWSIDNNDRKKAETSVPKPLSALTVYPPNTPVKLVPRVLPTKRVQTALFKEVKVMEEIFDQMNDEVDQNTVDKQCAEIERKNILITNENLIANCLSNQLLYDVEKSRCLDLETEMSKIQEKDNVIRDLKVLVSNVNDRSCEPYNANDVTDLLEQNELLRVEIEKVKQHYKEMFESIKITRTSTNEKTSSLLTQIEDLKAQLEGNLKVAARSSVKTKVLAPGMYAIDVEPIPPRLKNNRNAHLTYINHLKESVETVREIVEEARVVKPLDNEFTERYSKAPSIPLTRKKAVTCTNNTQNMAWHQKFQQSNVQVIPSTGIWKPKGKLSDNSLNKTKQIWQPKGKLSDNSLNKTKQIWQPKGKLSDNSLNKTKQVWKATGKLFANVGYQWRPTGKKFTLGKLNCGYQWGGSRRHRKKRPQHKLGIRNSKPSKFDCFQVQVVQIILWYLDSGCSKLDLEEEMAPRWIIASQDETTGPSVHPEDATSTKMVRETLSHADAESGGNSEKVGSNSEQSHVALAGPNPEHMHDVFLATNYPKWEADDEEMAPVRISSGPDPIMMTPGQLNSGLAPSPIPATTYIPPTDKDLEILFQPMFDEYFDQSTDSEPVPTATVVNAPIVSTNTSVSTTIAQDAPSTSRYHCQPHKCILHIFPQGEPSSAQSTSGDVSLAEPNQVSQPPDHLRKWTKDHPLDNIIGNPSRPVRLGISTKSPIYVMVIALKWIYKVKLDEDVMTAKQSSLVANGYRQEKVLILKNRFAPVA
ncbi:hypothetical protein Tco_0965705 [Tanacetum coccineum]